MFKKITLFALALVLASQPALPTRVEASSGDWDAPLIEAVWNYGDYRVERLAFTDDSIGPISLGDTVLVADPADSCSLENCDVYHLTVLKDGLAKVVPNVPAELLNETRFHKNDDRFIFVSQVGEDDEHYTVVELDSELSEKQVLVEDAFFTNVKDIDAMVDGEDIYFSVEFHNNDNKYGYTQRGTYIWDHKSDLADIIGKHWALRHEKLNDVEDGTALTTWEFEKGNEQMWLMHAQDNDNMYFEAIPHTWTEPEGDIVGAHFTQDGSIEYFQYYVRHTFTPGVDDAPVRHEETLSWYRPVEDALQIVNGRMAWVNAEDTLFVSEGDEVTDLGTAPGGIFTLLEDRIFYATPEGGSIYEFRTGVTTDLSFGVTDVHGDMVVGTDLDGTIWYQNLETGAEMQLGEGSDPVISDDLHVYWHDADGIYEATIAPVAQTRQADVSAVKTADSPEVYLISGAERQYIPDEKTYFTWFDEWDEVETVSETLLATYADAGTAPFAPGTKVKFANDAKVYVVSSEGSLHWIMTQNVAYTIYGPTWNKDILEVTPMEMIPYPYGVTIGSEAEYLMI